MPRQLKDKRIRIYGIDWDTERPTILKGEVWAHFRSMSVRET